MGHYKFANPVRILTLSGKTLETHQITAIAPDTPLLAEPLDTHAS